MSHTDQSSHLRKLQQTGHFLLSPHKEIVKMNIYSRVIFRTHNYIYYITWCLDVCVCVYVYTLYIYIYIYIYILHL
jgi:hypothetical protein